MEKVREGKRTVVEVGESGERSPTALTYTNVTYFTNFTYYHAPKALSTNSIGSIVFGHGIVFVGRWCWRPPSGSGAWITHDVAVAFGRGEYGGDRPREVVVVPPCRRGW